MNKIFLIFRILLELVVILIFIIVLIIGHYDSKKIYDNLTTRIKLGDSLVYLFEYGFILISILILIYQTMQTFYT